jgi:serine/threonine protein kinase
VLKTVASSGLGEVFLAEDQQLHRQVALKEIQERHADNPVSRGRFLLEAEITGGLEHPGIVPVYGLGQYADGRPFYAMRFIKGDNLNNAIRRFHEISGGSRPPLGERRARSGGRTPPETSSERRLAFRQLLGRFVDVCDAIAYAHSRGILHRDLKPGNIMLGLGDAAAAGAAAGQLLRKPVDAAKDPYDAARLLARGVSLVEKDALLPATRRKELARVYGDRAVAAVRQAVRGGFPDVSQMKKDKDLNTLRDREDFRKLLAEVEAKAKPPAK